MIIQNEHTLYRKNNNGKPTMWSIRRIEINKCIVSHGIVGGNIRSDTIILSKFDKDTEFLSMIKAKRKIGYKYLEEIKDNSELPDKSVLYEYLLNYLPSFRTNIANDKLHMLAKTLTNKFNFNTTYAVQRKINGLRCGIFAYTTDDIFSPIRLRFQSREGGEFTKLNNLEAKLLELIPKPLLEFMIEEGAGIDGELYIHGQTLNNINSAVKNENNPLNKFVSFWCYDVIHDTLLQSERFNILYTYLFDYIIANSEENSPLVFIGHDIISDFNGAVNYRDNYIEEGFEGIIIRDLQGIYQFGKRNNTMLKFKRTTDGIFDIVDIVPQSEKLKHLPMLIVRNDINNELFECRLNGTEVYQESVLKYKDKFLDGNHKVYISYGERSGVKSVPFHIKEVHILNYGVSCKQ